ncbi:DNRLRE domain-containing protein [Streptomyces sp. JJ36]|uniref:golvesin C-terminal-like domain-containing protein n=1 Tax=Streptomyces sp. JJ36 TaxID=2736645 RepID=UPI001F2A2D85|nr:DNRLRE domain-containing protein [Streptomyces sp. JJ36]MCF6526090.1 DNRLRE domain-containing protein [Streptomyces sp. JJ36]
MKVRYRRFLSCLAMSAVLSTLLPQVAYAAPDTGDDDTGVVDTVKGWFSDDEDDSHRADPPHDDRKGLPSRDKLPPGKNAPKAERVKELTSKRTPNARFWQLDDGRVQAELSTVPTAYKTAEGDWKKIDTAVRARRHQGFTHANTTNLARTSFGDSAKRLVRFAGEGGRAVTFGLENARGATLKPEVDGDTVVYTDAVAGADLTYRVGRGRLKEDITLDKRPDGPVSFTFTLDTDGLKPKARKDGSIVFRAPRSGDEVMVIPAPYMTDAKKVAASPYEHAYSRDVTQKLTRKGENWQLTVTPDPEWLLSEKRRYPVVIDPTITVMPLDAQAQDAMVLSDQPAVNFGGAWNLSVGRYNGGVARSLLKFPLDEIPAGVDVDAARLEVYFDQAHTDGNTDVLVKAHRATGAWDESTATWDNTSGLLGERSANSVMVDNGDPETAASGTWPQSTSSLTADAIGDDYQYNKNSTGGESYTWQPEITESGTYRTYVHYVPAFDRATNAPYTVHHDGGSKSYTVDQSAGSGGEWQTLGNYEQLYYQRGTKAKVVLDDTPASSDTAVIADAVRVVNPAQIWKNAAEYSEWHKFPVKDTVQQWVDGTHTNHGFVLKAKHEDSAGPLGGPRYESAHATAYGGEIANYPRLTVTYGKVGTALDSPTVVHGTGPELHWDAYENRTGDPGDEIVEYQIHRSSQQDFTPSAATLVAPVEKSATSFTDTTAVPTPDSYNQGEIGKSYFYQIAVKTKSGELLGSPTRIVGIPKAGRTMKIIQAGQTDTTLSSADPDTNLDDRPSYGEPQTWLEVGNYGTYGTTRAVLDFPTADIPDSATVIKSTFYMWAHRTFTQSDGAVYNLHPLNRGFDEQTATWNNADTTTPWSNPGGDYSSVISDYTPQWSNDVGRHWWDATSLTQSWVDDPAGNKGVMVKLADESASGPQERTMFLSAEGQDKQLRPYLQVIYVDATADNTYYAPQTPSRMIPGDTSTVDVTLTNTTGGTWTAADHELSYRWALPDGTDATTGGNQIATALPAGTSLAPGESVTVQAQVKAPINSTAGNKRTDYVLTWDVRNKSTGAWVSGSDGIPGLAQDVAVEEPTSNQLGLESFYSYAGKNTGAGSTVMNNLYAGNNVWSYNAFTNPGRGLSTFARFSYNSLDTSDTVLGHGWSAQLAAPLRSGAALDFHPNPNPTEVTLPDGDGTSHTFTWDETNQVWEAPAGVHYLLEQKPGVDCKPSADGDPRAWSMTRPDRTRFFFDCDGYLTAITDKNGNTQTYTYEERKSRNKPVKFLRYLTDPAGRQSLTVDYYAKGDDYTYIDDTGTEQSDTNLTNPKIIDHIRSITDISGRKVTFVYTAKGLMAKLTDGAGSAQPKVFRFTYDATQGNKNVKLVEVTDPRGNATAFDYYDPSEGEDPAWHWRSQTITDRLGHDTGFAYTDPDGTSGSVIRTDVTDAEAHTTTYVQDGYGRPTQITNAQSETTKLSWDAENNVTRLEEANGAVTTYAYDPKTGYPTETKDAEANANGTAGTTLTYATSLNGHVADLWQKTSPEGRTWQFGYDSYGNLTSVTDPKGVATTTTGDYTTTYAYDSHGRLTEATDAGGNTTTHSDFGPTGYPKTITDALGHSSTYVYDERGQVLEAVDALGKKTTQTYDVFGRPLESTVPKDQDAGEFLTTPAPVYDANDNVTQATAPNGAVSTATYDAADQITAATAPKDTPTGDERRTTYAYDKVGNLLTTVEPKGNLTTATGDYTTTHAYDAIYQLTSVTNAQGDRITYTYDNVGNVTKVVDPRKDDTADPDDYTTTTAYDLNHRVTSVTDAAGHSTSRTYDKDGLVLSTTDAEGNTTRISYDERGKPTEVKVPHSKDGSGNITYRTTRFAYDQVGNRTKVISPRGVQTTGDDQDFVSETVYDALNRPKEQIQPYDPDDARYHTPVKTITSYDAVGRVSKTSMPPSEGQSVRNETTYSYYDNGWIKSSEDAWDITTSYDYNALGQQTARTLTSAGGSSSRTMGWSYYPDGKLKSRTDDGVPVGKHVVLADNSDTQNTSFTGTWDLADAPGQQGYDHATHAAGTGTDVFTWTLNIPEDGTYDVAVKYPEDASASASATYTVTHSTGTADRTVDQSAGGGTWVSLGSYAFTQGNDAKLELAQDADGKVLADAVKLVRDTSGETDTEQRDFSYTYDVNGNLTGITDNSSNADVDSYDIAYTGLNQVQEVRELSGGVEQKATSYTYNANGRPLTLTHPDQHSAYEYDVRDLVSKVTVGKSPTDADPKITTFGYTPRGQKKQEVKGNGNIVDHTYFLDGALKTQVENKPGGTLVSSHTYAYDPNGNKARDVSKKMNADDTSAYLSATKEYSYDPADRLAEVVTTGTGAGTETYVHDANANVISQTIDGTTTTYTYDRNRLLTVSVDGQSAQHNYDPFGRQESVTLAGEVIARKLYDGFDHVVEHTKRTDSGAMETTTYSFDPLDRLAAKTVDGETTEFDYLGLSGQVLDEEVAGEVTKSYQYSPWGQRLSQVTHNSDGTSEDAYYGYNSHTDVETLTTDSGSTKATYGYTAYGSNDEDHFTGIDKPDVANPDKEAYNPYRFNSKRWDAASGTYDMGFRSYDPGLNRFTTRDMYTGALADMSLGMDPFTGNRYAFTAGNPISRIELDGHMWDWDWGEFGSTLKEEGSKFLSGAKQAAGDLYGNAAGCLTGDGGACKETAKNAFVDYQPIVAGVRAGMGLWSRGTEIYGDLSAGRIEEGLGKLTFDIGLAALTKGASRGVKAAKNTKGSTTKASGAGKKSCDPNSFIAGTAVLMADRSTKPIEDLEVGDQVLATDEETGRTAVKTVTAEIIGDGLKHLVTLTVDTDGDKGDDTSRITATDEHPFWAPKIGKWVDATDLKPGTWLRTSAGTWVKVTAIEHTTLVTRVYNLTIADTHTYYVLAGETPVLVHNTNAPIGCGLNGEPIYDIPAGSSGGPGAGQRIPADMLRDYNIGVNADPSLPTPLCSYCRTNPAQAVDHVEPRVRGGDLTDANTTPACRHCNSSKRDQGAPLNPPAGYTGPWPPPHWPPHIRRW